MLAGVTTHTRTDATARSSPAPVAELTSVPVTEPHTIMGRSPSTLPTGTSAHLSSALGTAHTRTLQASVLPLSVPPPSLDPKPRAVLSAQCPVPGSQGSQPRVRLLAPKVPGPQGRTECQAQEALRATVLASALDVFS